MMKQPVIFIILLLLLTAGNIVFPSFFYFRENVLAFSVMMLMLIARPLDKTMLFWTGGSALLTELMLGLPLASVLFPLALLMVCVTAVSRFFNMFPFHDSRSPALIKIVMPPFLAAGFFVLFSLLSALTGRLWSDIPVVWQTLPVLYAPVLVLGQIFILVIMLTAAGELISRWNIRRRFYA